MIDSIEKGRKEDGNRSIADKIIRRLHDLDKTVENNQGRWAWELLQNAKDSIAEEEDRTVSIQIELNKESVEFRHNGTHFTERDIRGLINQISSKEIEEGQHTKKTGRFGTGFLTTHLLSKVIQIKGIVQTESNDFYSFAFPLDRKGKNTTELVPKIENAWSEFHKSAQETEHNYDRSGFNTAFCYKLETESQRLIAKIGIEEFSKLIPFVLAFIPKINRVEIIDNTTERNSIFERKNDSLFDGLIIPILKTENQKENEIFILFSSKNKVAIAAELEKIENGYSVKNNKNIPKIFCDFPLIGTENFYFPVIVNSFFFNPQTERDGVWLKGGIDDLEVKENQEILEFAVELYKDLVSQVSEQSFFDLYNLAETKKPDTNEKYFDENWYKNYIQNPLKEFIYNAKIVELENEENKNSIRNLLFPLKSYPDKVQLNFWEFIHDLSPQSVCKKNQLHEWCKLAWDSWNIINYQVLADKIKENENINKLSQVLGRDENITFHWLKLVYEFILEDDTNLILFEKYTIIPNQNGNFKKKSDLYIDEIENENLLNILKLLGDDWKDILLNKKIKFGEYHPKNKKYIADKITEKVHKIQNFDSFKEAISRLLEWFDNYPKLGEEFFSELYKQRAELFVNIIDDKDSFYDVVRSNSDFKQLSIMAQTLADNPELIQKIADMDSLLKEFNITEIDDLKEMLNTAKNSSVDSPKIVITQDVLLSLGITSIDEFNEALKDKHLSNQFIHTSTPSKDMFDYVQELISRTKTNVIEHLKTLDKYNCDELEELAPTVIGGIKKNERDIYIVIRPSDNKQVIIYYGSEKDILDSADAELWIDNGINNPRHLTLGKILKKTGINKIPV